MKANAQAQIRKLEADVRRMEEQQEQESSGDEDSLELDLNTTGL